MKMRTSRRGAAAHLPFGPTSARTIKDTPSEQRRVLKRLEGLIEMHQESAARMNVDLGVEDILIVIDALEAEAKHNDPLRLLKCSDEVREYVRFSLYDEMLAEPSNVFLATPVNADTTRYEAMPRAFWVGCLRALRKEWEAKSSAPSSEDLTASPEVEGLA